MRTNRTEHSPRFGCHGDGFPEDDAPSFCDLDHDGRLEVVLKNRNAPQLRILAQRDGGHRPLRFLSPARKKKHRDGMERAIHLGSWERCVRPNIYRRIRILAQHSKEIFFWARQTGRMIRATIAAERLSQELTALPANHRIAVEEAQLHLWPSLSVHTCCICTRDHRQRQNQLPIQVAHG